MKIIILIALLIFNAYSEEKSNSTVDAKSTSTENTKITNNVAKNRPYELFETNKMPLKSIYDELLPFFIRMIYTNSEDPLENQITVLNDYLWTWNSVKSYEKYIGLGTNVLWNTSNKSAFDNMQCSEIDLLAAASFSFKHNISRLDVISHTLYEIQDNLSGRLIMVDPYFNPKIVNEKGQLATFEEVSNFKKFNLKSLRMNKQEFTTYINLFQKEKYKAQTKEDFKKKLGLRKTTFGARKIYPKFDENKYKNMSLKELNIFLKNRGIDQNSDLYQLFIMKAYHIPSIYSVYEQRTKNNVRKFVWKLQDVILKQLKSRYSGIIWSKEYYEIWEARQYQVLGRFDIAEKIFLKLMSSKNINKKQISEYIEIGKRLKNYL